MVKQIFNVEFLENIDNELMNCYHKVINNNKLLIIIFLLRVFVLGYVSVSCEAEVNAIK